MHISNENWLSPKHVHYTIDGTNLYELRRARLRRLAGALGLPNDGGKNDLLHLMIAKLKSIGAPQELTELRAFRESDEPPILRPVEEQLEGGARITTTDDMSGAS